MEDLGDFISMLIDVFFTLSKVVHFNYDGAT